MSRALKRAFCWRTFARARARHRSLIYDRKRRAAAVVTLRNKTRPDALRSFFFFLCFVRQAARAHFFLRQARHRRRRMSADRNVTCSGGA